MSDAGTVRRRRPDGQVRFGLMWFNSQTPYLTSAVAAGMNPPVLDVGVQSELARAAETAGFDFLFMADGYVGHGGHNVRIGHGEPRLSAPVWAPVLMAATRHIGVATTIHTKYLPAGVIARIGANLDHLSGGRWGWNIVPGTKDDAFLGHEPLGHAERYAQARETLDAVQKIWDARGERVEYHGRYHDFAGSMMGPFPLQERPLLFNAGVSEDGLDFIADACDYGFFTVVEDLDKVRGPVEALAARAEARGRDPLTVNLLGSIGIVVGASRQEAQDRYDHLVETLDMDAARGWARSFLERSGTYQATHGGELDDAARSIGVAAGATVLVGSVDDVAEQLIHVHRSTGLRGYQVCPLTWSVDELLLMGKAFRRVGDAGLWTAPEDRGRAW
ncbi:LLM class flavin-dependent oxidoreductase [Pseudonocardia zijingensis]|jgi:alkanesulfonate monooxygenase SsuD/methylene tetrahydromethanopterin reductase-like flavin-dependent oxidoreductase (luciferase family)|uniref:Luciferase-like domain-containing protein n=1 Tax=Pseudonocardia zijingensis TaxID=153376 RepID=A0ABN1NAT4_9PSEU